MSLLKNPKELLCLLIHTVNKTAFYQRSFFLILFGPVKLNKHSLNLILAAMAILVHGIRLNVLEFSGHLHLEWTGFKYAPFCNLKKA